MSQVAYTLQNPTDPEQIYALWDTGRIDTLTTDPTGTNRPLPILDAPDWFDQIPPPAKALYVTDWNVPAGYVLDYIGGVHAFGGADAVGTGDTPYVAPGVPYGPGNYYVDWSWDPDGTGQFYVMNIYGQVYNSGGAIAWPRVGPLWSAPYGRRIEMNWGTPKRAVILDYAGGRNQDWPWLQLPTDGYFDINRDWARDVKVTDWGSTVGPVNPSGYLLTADGRVYSWGPNAPDAVFGNPNVGNRGTQIGLEIISMDDPLTLAEVGSLGQLDVFTVSTPPTVTAGGFTGSPASTVTTTTRPTLAWDYSDPQADSQAGWQLVVWPQAYVETHDMSNPRLNRGQATVDEEGTDPTVRGITSPVDLDNGEYRMYVRAKDSSGLWSAWDDLGWEQDVPLPSQPDELIATVDEYHVNLLLNTAAPDDDLFAIFEYEDGDGWTAVRGAEAVPFGAVTQAVDYDIPLGVPRTYRARTYKEAPRVTSEPSPEVTVTAESRTFVLTSTSDATLGGEVWVTGTPIWEREAHAGVFQPMNSTYPIVVSGGRPKAQRRDLILDSNNKTMWLLIAALIDSDSTLLLRDPFGDAVYCRIAGRLTREQVLAMAAPNELTPLAHDHNVRIPLVEVARPEIVVAEDPDA